MDELLEILQDINGDIDYTTCKTLIDDGLYDSFSILTLVSEIGDAFDVVITPKELTNENFNSMEAMAAMIKRLQNS